MTRRARPFLPATLLLTLLAAAACDDDGMRGTFVARGVSAPSPSVSALVVPSTLPFQILPVAGCPFAPPYGSTFSLVIDGGGFDLLLYEAAFRFLDRSGRASPLTFSQADLSLLFGSTAIASRSSRTFAFQPQFGCGLTGAPHSMSARIVLVDRHGTPFVRNVRALMGGF